MEQCDNVEKGRIAEGYRHSIIQSVEHDENHPGTWSDDHARDSRALREQYEERGRQLDANESAMKAEYDTNHCEEVTGLSSADYRHQVVEDYTHEQAAGKGAAVSRGGDYWDETGKAEHTSVACQETAQNEQRTGYWESWDARDAATNEDANEYDKSKTNEASL